MWKSEGSGIAKKLLKKNKLEVFALSVIGGDKAIKTLPSL